MLGNAPILRPERPGFPSFFAMSPPKSLLLACRLAAGSCASLSLGFTPAFADEPVLRESLFAEITRALAEAGTPHGRDADGFWKENRAAAGIPEREEPRLYARELAACERLVDLLTTDPHLERPGGYERLIRLVNRDHALVSANEALMQRFAALREDFVRRELPPEIIARHDAAVTGHSTSHDTLLSLLERLRATIGTPLERAESIDLLNTWFQENPATPPVALSADEALPDDGSREPESVVVDRAELDLDPNGFPVELPPPPAPKNGPPVPGDLAQTLEVQFAPEIVHLADELGSSPLAIFNWVRANIEFDPYVGSRRGAAETLRLRAGNDMDQASLLIALLRASGIPARYGIGMVEMPADAAANWLGVQDPFTAGSILTTAGLEGVTITDGSEVDSIRCRRVWVEAFVPFSNYRGAGDADGESLWIRLDPAFKPTDLHIGVDIATQSGFAPNPFLNSYFLSTEPVTVLEKFEQTLSASLAALDPPLTLAENRLRRPPAAPELPWLPASLPNKLLTVDSTFTEIPANRRFSIRFFISGQGATLDHTVPLPLIAGKQVTLSYIGATQADRDLITASGGVFGVLQPSLVKVLPQLRIDGCVVATGTGAGATLGVLQNSQFFFNTPFPESSTDSISNTIIAGNYEGLAIDTGRVRVDPGNAELSCNEDFTGGFLHRLGMLYLELNDQADRRTAANMQAVLWKGISIAILSQQIKVAYSGAGNPIRFDYAGLSVDADRAGATAFSALGNNITYTFGRIRGAQSSQNENLVFELNLGRESVSTIKILRLASLLNIPLFNITAANAATLIPQLNQSTSTRNAVIAEINAGKHVTIPRDAFTYFDWSGTGYIHIDPVNGTGGYIIAGGISGGATAEEEDSDPGCERADNIKFEPPAPNNTYSNCQTDPVTITVSLTGLDEECLLVSVRQEKITFTPADLSPGPHNFEFGSPGDCGCSVVTVTVTIKESGVVFQDNDGRKSVKELLEIAPPDSASSENIHARLADGPPTTRWIASGGATPPEQTGKDVTFSAPVPTHIVRSGLPALVSMLTPPDPAIIRLDSSAESCGEQVRVYAFSSREFEFSRASKGTFEKNLKDAGSNIGAALSGLFKIYWYLEDTEEQVTAVRDLCRKLKGPVKLEPSTSVSFGFIDKIEEDPKSNFVIYKLDLGGTAEAGVSLKFPVLTTAFVSVPPPLAEAAIEFMIEGKASARFSGIAEFHRGAGWIKAVYPEAVVALGVSVGLGARVTLLSGFAEMSVQASSGVRGIARLRPEIQGRTFKLPLTFQAEIGGLTAGYKTGAFWGSWTGPGGTWTLYEPEKVPAEPKRVDLLSLSL